MAAEDEDLSDYDIHLVMEALSTRKSKVVASCALSIKLLLTEIQQQLLDLMVDKTSEGTPASASGDDADEKGAYSNYLRNEVNNVSHQSRNEEDAEDSDEADMSITQDAVVTGATVPITGSIIKSPNPYPCPDCHEVFSTKKALSRHVARHNKADENDSSALDDLMVSLTTPCKQEVKSENDWENDRKPIKIKLSLVKSPMRLACEECGTMTLKQHMARHMLTHSGEKPFSCEKCSTAFGRKDKLKEHMKKHEEGYSVLRPVREKKSEKSKAIKCRKCEFATEDKHLMKEHRKTHPIKSVYKCEECDKEFHCPSHLEQHNIKHRNEKPYMCDMCGVSFSREPNLARHIRSHTNPAPFHCKFCNKPYHRNNELIVHERTHTGEKPYICEICGNGYASTKYLKRHLFTHTGLKPFKCDLCERAFARPENMRAHRKLHEKSSNRLPSTTDTIASAFHATQMDGVVNVPREHMDSPPHGPPFHASRMDSGVNSSGERRNSPQHDPPFHASRMDTGVNSSGERMNSPQHGPPFHASRMDSGVNSSGGCMNSPQHGPPFHASRMDSGVNSSVKHIDSPVHGPPRPSDMYQLPITSNISSPTSNDTRSMGNNSPNRLLMDSFKIPDDL